MCIPQGAALKQDGGGGLLCLRKDWDVPELGFLSQGCWQTCALCRFQVLQQKLDSGGQNCFSIKLHL